MEKSSLWRHIRFHTGFIFLCLTFLYIFMLSNGVKKAIDSLKNASDDSFCWLTINQMKTNPDKCYLIASGDNEVSICLNNFI